MNKKPPGNKVSQSKRPACPITNAKVKGARIRGLITSRQGFSWRLLRKAANSKTHLGTRKPNDSSSRDGLSEGFLGGHLFWVKQRNSKTKVGWYVQHPCVTLPETNRNPLKMDGWKMNFFLRWPIFRCYVNYRERRYLYVGNGWLSHIKNTLTVNGHEITFLPHQCLNNFTRPPRMKLKNQSIHVSTYISIGVYFLTHTQKWKSTSNWVIHVPAKHMCRLPPQDKNICWLQRWTTKQPSSRSISRIPNDNQSLRLRDESTNVENTLVLQVLISFIQKTFVC